MVEIGPNLSEFAGPAAANEGLIPFPIVGLALAARSWQFSCSRCFCGFFSRCLRTPQRFRSWALVLFFTDTAVLIQAVSFIGTAIIRVNLHKRMARGQTHIPYV